MKNYVNYIANAKIRLKYGKQQEFTYGKYQAPVTGLRSVHNFQIDVLSLLPETPKEAAINTKNDPFAEISCNSLIPWEKIKEKKAYMMKFW